MRTGADRMNARLKPCPTLNYLSYPAAEIINERLSMKKILVSRTIHSMLRQEKTFLNRADVKVFVAATNDEALKIHHTERADLIITHLDTPGMASEHFCSLIREQAGLRQVSMIIVCVNTAAAIKASSRCKANAVLLEPVHPVLLVAKAQQLLYISARETLRVLLSANVDGHSDDGSFYCRTRNVSASGMLIETDKRLREGARLSCQFYLPNAKRIEASGKIVRIIEQNAGEEDYQYGLMFTDIVPECRQLLADYIKDTLKKTADGTLQREGEMHGYEAAN